MIAMMMMMEAMRRGVLPAVYIGWPIEGAARRV